MSQNAQELHSLIHRLSQVSSSGDPAEQRLGQMWWLMLEDRLAHLKHSLLHRTQAMVQTGPFFGMRYIDRASDYFLVPRLLGCYEAELHPILESIARAGYARVINIGCGEGYYAVGLLRRLEQTRMHAFDTKPLARELCRELARVNDVTDRLAIGGECGVAELRSLAGRGTLIVCDCEGGERALLDPEHVPELSNCDILVELHHFMDPALTRDVPARFANTHSIRMIDHEGRNPNAIPVLRGLPQLDQWLAVWEGRPGPTPWAFLACRSS